MKRNRKLITETGEEYYGECFGSGEDRLCELVFNTSMAGYQEILSDPSYAFQAIVMSYPLIGNYGMAADDYETARPVAGAMIVREYNDYPSNFRSVATLGEVMERYGIPGIAGVDTRKLVRSIRDHGSMKALIVDAGVSLAEGLDRIRRGEIPKDAVSAVSRKAREDLPAKEGRFRVAAIDCGMKNNIVRCLNRRGCDVIALPWNTSAEEILSLAPDGVFLSNGPGDPTDVPEVIETVGKLRGKFPIFGICLGHQILSLAYGAKTYKLKFGHRGGNHPVRDVRTGKIEITSQNHSYAVDANSLAQTRLTATHFNLLDGTVEGVMCEEDRAFGVQYHPESAPGPQDSGRLFDAFIAWMEKEKTHA